MRLTHGFLKDTDFTHLTSVTEVDEHLQNQREVKT